MSGIGGEFICKEIITKTVINSVVDGYLSNYAGISVVSTEPELVELVIGSRYVDREACTFTKDSVAELIEVLQEIHDVME